MAREARRFRGWERRLDEWLVRLRGIEQMRETDERVLAQHRRLFGENAFTVINGKYRLSNRLRAEGRYEKALELTEQVLMQRTERYGPDHRKTRQAKLGLAVTLSKLDRPEEAKEVLSHLIPVCARVLGDADGETQSSRLWLASVLIDLGDYGAAQQELSKVSDAAKARGKWWDPEAEERTKGFWRIVTSEGPPD